MKAVFGTKRRRWWRWKTEGAIVALAVCLYDDDDAYSEKEAAWAGWAAGSMAYHSQMKAAMRA